MSEPTPQPDPLEVVAWLQASAADFEFVDINAPLVNAKTVDAHEASALFGAAAKSSSELQRASEGRVYSMLGAVCSFYFKPNEQTEPYGPMMRFMERRSAQPSDFKGAPANALHTQIERATHPALRARLADLVWLLDRKQHAAAAIAVSSYCDIVQSIIDKTRKLRHEQADEHSFENPQYLKRALQIGKAIGWDKEPVARARDLVSKLRASAAAAKNIHGFLRFAALDLDYQISDPILVAEETENLANDEQGERRHSLMHSAARAYRAAKKQPDRDRCLVDAAEALVVVADGHRSSAMGETHWLEKAVNELRRLPAAKARCLELKHRLIDAQSRILDEMQSYSHSDDIAEVVDHARSAVTDKPLATTLRIFAILSHAPDPDVLEDEARRMIAEHPLSSLFASTHYDGSGKPVHRTPGGGLGDDGDRSAIDEKIAQSEKIRRSIVATGTIEPMRQTIITEHNVDDRAISLLCNHSRFVPSDRVAIFSSGLGHFFQGDMIAALHTLLPQIENSLRHILRLHGHDVIKINDDMTQEEMGFTQLLARLRPQLDEIFGTAMITDLENVFIYRGGPQLRDRTTHGLIGQWEPFSEDSIYACWLIYQLCCLPLLPYWNQLEDALNS